MHERLKGLRAEREGGRDRIARLPEQTEKEIFELRLAKDTLKTD